MVSAQKIWDAAPHNAFTDLERFKGRWFCVFREGQAHVSPDGKLRVITSTDGRRWTSAALMALPDGDLRDAKIVVTPAHELMLSGAVALREPSKFRHQSLAWFSHNGRRWSAPIKIGDPNFWLWRVVWHQGAAYSVGYHTVDPGFVRLYRSQDGGDFKAWVPTLFDQAEPNESALVFLPDETCLCVLRRDGQPGSGVLGEARPPYVEWRWRDLGVSLGGPQALRLPDGRIVVAARHYGGGAAHTSLLWLEPEAAKLTEFLRLPSGGDCSYPGLVWYRGLLWVSYYSSHEGKTSIYLAKIRLPPRAVSPVAPLSGRRF
ncbi:MAG: glycoside hydrolase [Verrucomicrobia bacterium]|nr:glycoside hydrolase [Verrucomicrobiota bacterium]